MQFFIATAIALAALTAAAPTGHVLHEKRHFTGEQWVKRSRVPAHVTLPFKIGLTQSGIDAAEDHLQDM